MLLIPYLRKHGLLPLIFLILLSLDQGSKIAAHKTLLEWEQADNPSFYTAGKHEVLHVGSGNASFYIGFSYVRNFAAAFDGKTSLDQQNSSESYVLIAALALLVGVLIYFFLGRDFSRIQKFACVSIFSGLTGNLLDRLRLGYVIDILDMRLPALRGSQALLPHANLADVFMVLGVLVIAGTLIIRDLRRKIAPT